MIPAPHPFELRLARKWPPSFWQDVTVVVAVSGGADSVALVRALHAVRERGAGRLIIAHCNHRLRGEQSDADARFVENLACQLDLECQTGSLDPAALMRQGDGLEAAARQARYDFLRNVCSQYGARYLATAHTADDQAETILHRLLRGTGVAGLAGIPRVRLLTDLTTIVRPLLWARRSEVIRYLADLGQDYRQDETNLQSQFTRNRLRNELLPQLADEYNPAVVEALLRLGRLAGEAQAVLTSLADTLRQRAVSPLPDGWRIEVSALQAEPRYLVREMFVTLWRESQWPMQDMGLEHWDALADLLLSDSPLRQARTFPGSVCAIREDGALRLTR